jgi:DNA polymerase-3 subunit beta
MRFVTTQALLYQALAKAAAFVPANPTHPILRTLLISTLDESAITITGFDLQSGCVSSAQATVVTPGAVAINKQLLSDLISRLSGDIEFQVDKNFAATVTASTGSYQMAGADPSSFMALPTIAPETKISLGCNVLKQLISFTKSFYTNEPTKQILTGVHFKYSPDKSLLVAAATDSHKLAVQAIICDGQECGDKAFEAVIPGASLQKISRLLESTTVSVELGTAWIRLVFSSGENVVTRKLEGKYPAYEQLLPKKFELEFVANRKELLASLDRVSLFSGKNSNIVQFCISQKTLELSAKIETDSGQEIITIEPALGNSQTEQTIAFNNKYLINAIQSCSSDLIRIKLNQPSNPVIITPESEEENTSSLVLIMPVQIAK